MMVEAKVKVKVEVEGRVFEVEVGDLNARPIVAVVEGERFEVWPEVEGATPVAATPTPAAAPARPPRPTRRTSGEAASPAGRGGKAVFAPLPGVIDSLAIRPGDEVAAGQPLCIIEAMKMKNIIRAPRAGVVAAVGVVVGQHVKHNDLLVEYRDA